MLDDDLLGESSWRGPSGLRRPPFYKRTWFSALLAFVILLGVTVFGVFVFLVQPLRDKAETYDLEECKKLESASIIYDRNGGELGRIYMQNRSPVKLSEVPAHFKKALISQEDSRFYEHHGVDYIGLARAIWITIRLGGKVTQGASTITQQLARNTFGLTDKTKTRKILEAFLSIRIEKHYSKEEIMELYLNRIYFGGFNGQNFHGVQAAAQGYFGKDVRDLTVEESATICGLIKAPNLYSPLRHPEASKGARNQVLRRMVEERYLTPAEAMELENKPIITTMAIADPRLTYTYDEVRQEVIKLVGEERAATGGFRIYTSIDPELQRAADEAVRKRLVEVETRAGWEHQTYAQYRAQLTDYRAKIKAGAIAPTTPRPVATYLQGAALVINNADGAVLALVGGRDFRDSQFNRAFQARPPVGTAFTPLVFAAAYSRPEFFPGTQVDDNVMDNKRVMIDGMTGLVGEWGQEQEDANLMRYSGGKISLREVLVRGQNAGTVRVGEQVGLPAVIDLAKRAGIESPLKEFPSSFLGASEARLDEMCLAYTAFPNKGTRPKAIHVVNRITDTADKPIYQIEETESAPVQVMDEIAAWQVNSSLVEALDRGTGSAARSEFALKKFPAANKTGTDYKFANMWDIGYTSAVTCGVWVGFDKPTVLYPFAFSNRIALPIWADIMNATVADYKPEPFTPPENAERVEICLKSNQRATDFCNEKLKDAQGRERSMRTTYPEVVRPGTLFDGICTFHKGEGLQLDLVEFSNPIGKASATGSMTGGNPAWQHIEPVHMQGLTILGDDPFRAVAPVVTAPVASGDGSSVRRATPVDEGDTSSLPLKLPPPKPVKIEP